MISDEMRALRDQVHEPEVLLRPEGAFFNAPMIRRIHGHWDAMAGFTLDGADIEWREIGGQAVVRAEDLRALFEAGVFGESDMMRGRVQIFQLRSRDDLAGLPFPGGLPAADGFVYAQTAGWSLRDRFKDAARRLRLAANTGGLDYPGQVHELPVPIRERAWAAKGGDPRRGPAANMEAAMPFEIGWDAHRCVVLWIRSLAGEAVSEEA